MITKISRGFLQRDGASPRIRLMRHDDRQALRDLFALFALFARINESLKSHSFEDYATGVIA